MIQGILNIPKNNSKTYTLNKEIVEQTITDLKNKVIEDMAEQLKEGDTNSNLSDEWIRNFIETYFDFNVDYEEDIITKSYIITVTPYWKENNMINFEKAEKLLNKGVFEND